MTDTLYLDPDYQPELPDWQRSFNHYIEQIRDLKTRTTKAQNRLRDAETRIQQEINPMISQIIEHKIKFVQILDEAYEKGFFKGSRKERIRELIQLRALELIHKHGRYELEKLSRKYSDDPFERFSDVIDSAEETISSLFESLFGETDKRSSDSFWDEEEEKPRFRVKKRFTKEADQLQKVLRTLYTRLVKQLHPDREQDEAKREEKTLIMQAVTQAYEARDWFELLRLQNEHLNDDPEVVESLSPEQVQHLNQELHEQYVQLERELDELTRYGDSGFIYRRFCSEHEGESERKFAIEKARLQKELVKLRDELENILENRDPKPRFKIWE
ncbi:MAG: hypothetical protein AAF740_06150 [Bacteroidota bacterium]